MPNINELNIPDPKKDELIRQRQARIAAIAAMPDDDPVEADWLCKMLSHMYQFGVLLLSITKLQMNLSNVGKIPISMPAGITLSFAC